MKKQISQKSFNAERLRVLNHGYGGDSGQQQQNGYAQQQRVPPTRSTTALHLGTPQQQQMMLSQQAGTNSPQQQQQPARSGIVKATTPKVGSRKTVFANNDTAAKGHTNSNTREHELVFVVSGFVPIIAV